MTCRHQPRLQQYTREFIMYVVVFIHMDDDKELADEIATAMEDLLAILPQDPDAITDDVRHAMDAGANRIETLKNRIDLG